MKTMIALLTSFVLAAVLHAEPAKPPVPGPMVPINVGPKPGITKPAAAPISEVKPKWSYYRDAESQVYMGELVLEKNGTFTLTSFTGKRSDSGTWKRSTTNKNVLTMKFTSGTTVEEPSKIVMDGDVATWERKVGVRYLKAVTEDAPSPAK